jgi:hypothetical protein
LQEEFRDFVDDAHPALAELLQKPIMRYHLADHGIVILQPLINKRPPASTAGSIQGSKFIFRSRAL